MRRIVSRVIILVLAAIVAVALTILTWPQFVNLEDQYGIAQILSFRVLMIFGAGVPVVILLVFLIFRRTRFFAISFLVVFVAFAAANSLILNARGWGTSTPAAYASAAPATDAAGSTAAPDPAAPATADPAAPASAGATPAPAALPPAGSITVLSWNIRGASVSAQTIADLAISSGAQVISLPEGFGDTAKEVATLMGAAGTPMWSQTNVAAGPVGDRATSLLIAEALGQYQVSTVFGDTSTPSVVATPVNGVGPTIAAVHPVAPGKEQQMALWRSDLTWITGLCAQPNVIVAGDFNATLDHLTDLARCQDAARATGAAAVGTWPVSLPALMSAPIDHVMSTTSWRAVSFNVVTTEDKAGSDHRPIVSVLAPVG